MPKKAKEKTELTEKSNIAITEKKEKKTANKKTSTTKRSSTSKKAAKNTSKKATKTALEKKTTIRKTVKKEKQTKKQSIQSMVEYYDLPFRYNQTIIRILAQTPNTLFIYWDISDDDRKTYTQKYGDDFFQTTKPVLFITNETMNYTFEVEINDFANSWYLPIQDASCKYKIELGRRPLNYNVYNPNTTKTIDNYFYVTSSNEIEAPNDHILFDQLQSNLFFRNTKTNVVEEKNISSISYLKKIGKIYNIYDLYNQMYPNELSENKSNLDIPSSSSSTFK